MKISELFTDPFRDLTESVRERLFHQAKRERDAESRFQRLIDTYRLLLQDARYALVQQDVTETLGEELTKLVAQARTCAHCGPRAERIRLLQEMGGEPVQAVWTEAHRPTLPTDETDA